MSASATMVGGVPFLSDRSAQRCAAAEASVKVVIVCGSYEGAQSNRNRYSLILDARFFGERRVIPTTWGTWAKFWLGFLCGIVAIAIAIEIVRAFATLETEVIFFGATAWLGRFHWLYEYQTLITGLAAVYAAYLSVSAIRDQIRLAKVTEEDRRSAKLAASRTVLPLSLSAISDYASVCARSCHDMLLQCRDEHYPRNLPIPEFPPVPDQAISTLKEIVEYLNDDERIAFARLAGKLQVQSARLRGMRKDLSAKTVTNQNSIEDYTLDACEVYARCATLFDYARFESETLPRGISSLDVAGAVHNVGIFSGFSETLRSKASRHVYDEGN